MGCAIRHVSAPSGLMGIPPTAQLRMRPQPGDGLLIAVGAPDRVFIGDAVVGAGYHRFSEGEAARFPRWLAFDHGIALEEVRVWPRPVPVMDVWPDTVAAASNPRALWFGAITGLASQDAARIVAAGTRQEASELGERVLVSRVLRKADLLSDTSESPIARRGAPAPRPMIDHAGEAVRAASESPAWLPERMAHADWGASAAKCVVATAELRAGIYHAHAPQVVLAQGGLLERMRLSHRPGQTTLLGFDFPLGVPRKYARTAGILNFADWFRGLDLGSPFFDPAADVADVATTRPFFPRLIMEKSPGIKKRFQEALGMSGAEALRRCDRAHCNRPAASEMFWTLGPKAVGKATLAGWKQAIRAALAEPGRRYSIWPFDGPMTELLAASDAVIVETYPREAYLQLGLRMGTPGAQRPGRPIARPTPSGSSTGAPDTRSFPTTSCWLRYSTASGRTRAVRTRSTR